MFKFPWVKTPKVVLSTVVAPIAESVKQEVDVSSYQHFPKILGETPSPEILHLDEMINSLKPIELSQHGIGNVLTQDHNYVAAENITQPQLNKNSIIMSQTFLQRIETGVQNFLNKVENKLPVVLEEGATLGLKYTSLFQSWIDSGAVTDLTTLVPATEPLKVEIDAILAQLKTVFSAIDVAFAKGALFIAAGKIGQLQVGSDVPLSHVLLAVQAKYDTKTA